MSESVMADFITFACVQNQPYRKNRVIRSDHQLSSAAGVCWENVAFQMLLGAVVCQPSHQSRLLQIKTGGI